jgi:endogenous inhibitor of DNA gyrase (YacG/DUF329 family)
MHKLSNRISYLHGLAEGMGLGNSKEGRVIHEMIHVLKDMAEEMRRMQDRMEEQDEYLEAIDEDLSDVEDYVDTIDEDLSEVEDVIYEGNEDAGEGEWIYFDDEDEDSDVLHVDETYDEMAYDDDDAGYFEVECPNCQELVAVDQDVFDDDTVAEVLCPECHEVILINEDIEEMDEMDHHYRMEHHR